MQLRVSPIIAVSIPSAFGKQPQNRVRAEVDPAADEALFQAGYPRGFLATRQLGSTRFAGSGNRAGFFFGSNCNKVFHPRVVKGRVRALLLQVYQVHLTAGHVDELGKDLDSCVPEELT